MVLRKSLIFALLLIAFHIAEEAIRGWLKGLPLSDAVASLGGSLGGVVAYGAIFFVVLIPFYALQKPAVSSAALRFGTCSSKRVRSGFGWSKIKLRIDAIVNGGPRQGNRERKYPRAPALIAPDPITWISG